MTTLTQLVTKEITWDHIAEVCHNGEAKEFFNVGDVISITLKNNEKMRIAVAGIDTYAENEVIFAFKDILAKEQPMNKEHTNKGGYDGSDMAEYLDTEIFDLLPDDLQKVVKERRGHKLWLFSIREVFGEDGDYICPDDDVWLPYYQDARNRVKTRQGTTDWWWLASPSTILTTYFAFVDRYGFATGYLANYSYGVAPGFCI
jgi:hypothetical protein